MIVSSITTVFFKHNSWKTRRVPHLLRKPFIRLTQPDKYEDPINSKFCGIDICRLKIWPTNFFGWWICFHPIFNLHLLLSRICFCVSATFIVFSGIYFCVSMTLRSLYGLDVKTQKFILWRSLNTFCWNQ